MFKLCCFAAVALPVDFVTLKLTHPNDNEIFAAGSTLHIGMGAELRHTDDLAAFHREFDSVCLAVGDMDFRCDIKLDSNHILVHNLTEGEYLIEAYLQDTSKAPISLTTSVRFKVVEVPPLGTLRAPPPQGETRALLTHRVHCSEHFYFNKRLPWYLSSFLGSFFVRT